MDEHKIENGSEVLKKLDQMAGYVERVQKKAEELGEADAKQDGELKHFKEEVSQIAENISKYELKQKEQEKLVKEMEAKLARPGNGAKGEDPAVKEYNEALDNYLRSGIAMSNEVKDAAFDKYVEYGFKNISDSKKNSVKENLKTQINQGYLAGAFSKKEHSVVINPEGGYFVRPERSTMMIEREFETSPVRAVANVMTTTSDSVEIIIDDNEASSGGWVAEKQSRSNTGTADIGLLKIYTHEQYAYPKATQKILDDAGFNVESWIEQKTQDIITRTENTAFVAGDGSEKPKGFLSYDEWASAGTYQRNALERISSGIDGVFTADTIIKTQNSLKESYQARAVWMIKRASFEKIQTLKDGAGRYLLNPALIREGADKLLLGKPVIFADDMEAVGTDAQAMAYGDFSVGYTVVDRLGIRVIRDNVTDKPYVGFYTTKRVGGAVTNYEAIKIYKLSA